MMDADDTSSITTATPSTACYKELTMTPSVGPAEGRSNKIWRRMQPIFFNRMLKVAALRIVILTALITSAIGCLWFTVLFYEEEDDNEEKRAPVRSIVTLVAMVVTFVHHIISAFKFKFFLQIIDLPLIIAEIVLLSIYSQFFTFDRWSPLLIISVVIAIWSLISCLIFLAICRIVTTIRMKGSNLLKPFDLLEFSERSSLKGIPTKKAPAAISILLGRSIWLSRFPGESNIVRLLRGAFGGIFIVILVVYAVFTLAVYPVRETAVTPVKEYRVLGIPDDIDVQELKWHIGIMRPTDLAPDVDTQTFLDALQITPLWDDLSDERPKCKLRRKTVKLSGGDMFSSSYLCQTRTEPPNATSWASSSFPDLLIQFNFSMLGIPLNQATIPRNSWTSGIQVLPGLGSIIRDVMRTSTPITMLPNTNYLANLDIELRQIFMHPALSGLGIFDTTRTFGTTSVKSVVRDHLVDFPPDGFELPSGGNMATLRLYLPETWSELKIVQDYRERAVMDGFATIGGLWTFFGAVFAVLFGVSMSRIMFDVKPLSIFGLAQQFERQSIVEEILSQYPLIRSEIDVYPRDKGLLTLLGDHLFDIELLRKHLREAEEKQMQQQMGGGGGGGGKMGYGDAGADHEEGLEKMGLMDLPYEGNDGNMASIARGREYHGVYGA